MEYISSPVKFNTYSNGHSPYIGENGNWWAYNDVTGEYSDSGIAATGSDGISFDGVNEYYYATLATDLYTDKDVIPSGKKVGDPKTPSFDSNTWVNSILATKFGTKDNSGITYKYLWNIEEILSKDEDDNPLDPQLTNVDLIDIYSGGRVPSEYVSYYAANTTVTPPTGGPTLAADGNSISLPTNSNWKIDKEYTGSADPNKYLFEITFVKYAEKDDNGQNLYAKLAGPTIIGKNGKNGDNALTLSLSNDSDVIAIKQNGEALIPSPIETTVIVSRNGSSVNGAQVSLLSVPSGFSSPPNATTSWEESESESGKTNSFGNNKLSLNFIPDDFQEGTFVFQYTDLQVSFHLRTKQSEIDYNLNITQTVINSSNSGGSFEIIVEKTDSSGVVTQLDAATYGDWEVELDIDGSEDISISDTSVTYLQGESVPITVKLIGVEDNFIWDTEVVEFIHDGSRGTDGEVAYYLYHDLSTEGLQGPNNQSYDRYPDYNESGWYKVQQESSVYEVCKICQPGEQLTTEWGPIRRISGVLTTWDDWFNVLDNKSEKGIYKLDSETVGISADVIRTGAFSVGNAPTFDDNNDIIQSNSNKFYANVDRNQVLVAGWKVDDDELTAPNKKVGFYSGSENFGLPSSPRIYAGDASLNEEINFEVSNEDGINIYSSPTSIGEINPKYDKQSIKTITINSQQDTASIGGTFNTSIGFNFLRSPMVTIDLGPEGELATPGDFEENKDYIFQNFYLGSFGANFASNFSGGEVYGIILSDSNFNSYGYNAMYTKDSSDGSMFYFEGESAFGSCKLVFTKAGTTTEKFFASLGLNGIYPNTHISRIEIFNLEADPITLSSNVDEFDITTQSPFSGWVDDISLESSSISVYVTPATDSFWLDVDENGEDKIKYNRNQISTSYNKDTKNIRIASNNFGLEFTIISSLNSEAESLASFLTDFEKREPGEDFLIPCEVQIFINNCQAIHQLGSNPYGLTLSLSGATVMAKLSSIPSTNYCITSLSATILDEKSSWPFAVLEDGTLYAEKGKIGNMVIGDLVNNSVGRNLLKNTSNDVVISPSTTANYNYKALTLDFYPIKNEYYTFSADVYDLIGLSEGSLISCLIANGNNVNNNHSYTDMKIINGRVSGKIKIAHDYNEDTGGAKLLVYAGVSGSTSGKGLTFKKMKLEKGETATEWSIAPEDNLQSDVNNNFSWQFSPTDGIKMWNGPQAIGQEVFKVWNNNGTHELYMRGNGEFEGKIIANEGNIAGWGINQNGYLISYRDSNGNMATNPTIANFATSENRIGLFTNCPASPSITVSGNTKDNWRIVAGTNFGVDAQGDMFASSGEIGGWSISGTGIYKKIKDENKNELYQVELNSTLYNPSGSNWSIATQAANTVAIGIKKPDGSYPFFVRPTGEIYASKGKIAGFDFSDVGAKGLSTNWIAFRYDNIEFLDGNSNKVVSIGTSNKYNGSTNALYMDGPVVFGKGVQFSNGNRIYISGSYGKTGYVYCMQNSGDWTKLEFTNGILTGASHVGKSPGSAGTDAFCKFD